MLILDQGDLRNFPNRQRADLDNPEIPHGCGGLADQIKGIICCFYIALAANHRLIIRNRMLFNSSLQCRLNNRFRFESQALESNRTHLESLYCMDRLEEKDINAILSLLQKGSLIVCTNIFSCENSQMLYYLIPKEYRIKVDSINQYGLDLRSSMIKLALSELFDQSLFGEKYDLGIQYREGASGVFADSLMPSFWRFFLFCVKVIDFVLDHRPSSIYLSSDSIKRASMLRRMVKIYLPSGSFVYHNNSSGLFHTDNQYNALIYSEREFKSSWNTAANTLFSLSCSKTILASRGEYGYIASCFGESRFIRTEPDIGDALVIILKLLVFSPFLFMKFLISLFRWR